MTTHKHIILSIATLLYSMATMAQKQQPAYVLYNAKGKKVAYSKMLASLESKDMVLFGEYHNNPIAHWL